MKKGVIYTVWGRYDKSELNRSIDSVKRFGYHVTVCILDNPNLGLGIKAKMYEESPYDLTLFLDTDTVVSGDLDYGFEMANKFGIACCIAPASNTFEFSKKSGLDIPKDIPQYNTGVIFFRKDANVEQVFNTWFRNNKVNKLKDQNDQPGFALSIYENYFNPYVLPRNWNYREKIRYEAKILHGPLKILHAR